jgi:hypothetical protein
VKKYGRARQATDENKIRRMRFAFWITKATDAQNMFSTTTMGKRNRLNVTC